MLELLFCSLLTVFRDYLFRRFVKGKRFGKEVTLWFELRWGRISRPEHGPFPPSARPRHAAENPNDFNGTLLWLSPKPRPSALSKVGLVSQFPLPGGLDVPGAPRGCA
jgi:hypothetical protein